MPPDLNSLPPSRSTSSSPYHTRTMSNSMDNNNVARSISPRSSSISLQATATMNAAADSSRRSSSGAHRGSPQTRHSERRRSGANSIANLHEASHSDPTGAESPRNHHHRSSFGSVFRTHSPSSIAGSPVIGTGDPHHQRTPSLGELHQELEQEQEAQVNRLLLMIRNQQAQLQQLQQTQPQPSATASGTAIDDSTPTSERSFSFPIIPPLPSTGQRGPLPMGSSFSARRGSSTAMAPLTPIHPVGSQAESGTSTGGNEWLQLGDSNGRRSSRDENSYYQAETANLTRENQMLKVRIRELERQVAELTASGTNNPPQSTPQPSEHNQPVPTSTLADTPTVPAGSATQTGPQTPTAQTDDKP
ncbi:uncharacterized protein GIQ15_05844 [Arthroderma uncinatum]|uniref:uncharacterized protein n=1 Tax=Arthroderma uncinatum TaxID=74035 RepID=UPI00144AA9AE|nr:uncharacterized protein GIQ15_05844 [Arthroderma uncinatum]KAF3480497.1 hypothetical protein GIQ15_05844 [Arthroderma uncinatum]